MMGYSRCVAATLLFALAAHGFSLGLDIPKGVDPANPFPAGLPHLDNPFIDNLKDPWSEPELPKNAYRGLYVSKAAAAAAAMGQTCEHKMLQHVTHCTDSDALPLTNIQTATSVMSAGHQPC
jgi:hypothetical protein